MLAYHGDPVVKENILAQLRAHYDADELVKGHYWEDGKGCAVGCTVHSGDHAEYEQRFGIPQMLAMLEDRIFEGLPNDQAKEWPLRFMKAALPGTDLSLVGWKFQYWLLTDETVNPGIKHPLVADAVAQCAEILLPLTKGEPINESAAESAESAAWSAESAAWSAESAESAVSAAWSAESAARSAAWSAVSAAWSAESAARSAAESAVSAAWSAVSAARSAAWSAVSAAESAGYIRMADKLIELIEAA